MMLSESILITVIVVAAIVMLIICIFGSFYIFKTNRRGTVKVLEGLKYIPEVVIIKEEFIDVKKKLTKRQQRRKKMRELERELKLSESLKEDDEDLDENEEDMDNTNTFLSSPSSKLFTWVINTFSTKSNKIIPNNTHSDTDIELNDPTGIGFSSKSSNNNEDEFFNSTKSKRFLSKDRIQRKEARNLLLQPHINQNNNTIEIENIEETYDTTISLLSLNTAKKEYIQEIIEKRKYRKQLCQDTDNINTDMNLVQLNAGPPVELIPEGYELVSQDLGNDLINPDIIIYKRILYLWESSTSSSGSSNISPTNTKAASNAMHNTIPNTTNPAPSKKKHNNSSHVDTNNNIATSTTTPTSSGNNINGIIGWYIGTIVGISEQAEYNYRIKYDRKETNSIFVDGIEPVNLSLSGANAYGRRWVLLQKRTK